MILEFDVIIMFDVSFAANVVFVVGQRLLDLD
jgi:hypothetical protein